MNESFSVSKPVKICIKLLNGCATKPNPEKIKSKTPIIIISLFAIISSISYIQIKQIQKSRDLTLKRILEKILRFDSIILQLHEKFDESKKSNLETKLEINKIRGQVHDARIEFEHDFLNYKSKKLEEFMKNCDMLGVTVRVKPRTIGLLLFLFGTNRIDNILKSIVKTDMKNLLRDEEKTKNVSKD